MIIPLTIFATLLVAASVGISVLNWASMPTGIWGTYVAGAIALGVEGAKLFLVPYGFHIYKENKGLAWTSWVMGVVMTVVSVGGIVIWLDSNLSINAAAKADVAQVAAINAARIDIATTMIRFDRASKADSVLDKVNIQQPGAKPMGLTIPFAMTTGQRWGLLLSIALTIDLGALLLITILTLTLDCTVKKKKSAFDEELDAIKAKTFDVEYNHLKGDTQGGTMFDRVMDEVFGTPPQQKNLLNKAKSDTRAPAQGKTVSNEWLELSGVFSGNREQPPPPPRKDPRVFVDGKKATLKPREWELKKKIEAGDFGQTLPSNNKMSKEFKIRPASVRTVVAFLCASGKLEKTDNGLTLCEKVQTTKL